jgi:hypothetical protein
MRRMLAACIISLGLAVVALAGDPPVVTIDLARAKSLALDACMRIYAGTDQNALQYSGLTVTSSANDEVVVSVTYLLGGSGATENVEKDGFEMAKTKQTTYIVQMDTLGQIKDVSSGSSVRVQSISRKTTAAKTSEPRGAPVPQVKF